MKIKSRHHGRAIRDLLHHQAKLSSGCEDLEMRTRCNNSCIYGVKEVEDKKAMIPFIIGMICTLKLPEDEELGIEGEPLPNHQATRRSSTQFDHRQISLQNEK